MKNICIYFQIHHPFSFQTFRFFEIGESKSYYDDLRIEREINEATTNYYLPTNEFLLKLIFQSKGQLKLSFYISGTALDQFLMYAPMMINSFRLLADTGQVEFIGGTALHSIASLADNNEEFKRQIKLSQERIEYYFGQKPQVFVNTDLLFTSHIAKIVAEAGYRAIFTNGAKKLLQWRSPNYLYSNQDQQKVNILFRNEVISNEFSHLLGNPEVLIKPEPMKQLFAALKAIRPEEPLANIYLNYMCLGGFGSAYTHPFFRKFVSKIIHDQSFCFSLPSEFTEQFEPVAEIGTEDPVCWTNQFHSSYYPGNELQKEAINQLFKLEKQAINTENPNLRIDWQYLQSSDHFHLMDENHPAYLGNGSSTDIYKSKYDAFINYMNILEDFRKRLKADKASKKNRKAVHKTIDSHTFRREHVI